MGKVPCPLGQEGQGQFRGYSFFVYAQKHSKDLWDKLYLWTPDYVWGTLLSPPVALGSQPSNSAWVLGWSLAEEGSTHQRRWWTHWCSQQQGSGTRFSSHHRLWEEKHRVSSLAQKEGSCNPEQLISPGREVASPGEKQPKDLSFSSHQGSKEGFDGMFLGITMLIHLELSKGHPPSGSPLRLTLSLLSA